MRRKFRIGLRKGRLEDKARPSWNGDGPRPISWLAWYPADDSAEERAVTPRASWFLAGPVAADAALSEARTRYPVVMLSHGTGGTAWGMEWLGRRLAARGFVAVAVNHHGNSAVQPYRAEGFLCQWERARDLSVLLDHLLAAHRSAGNVFAGRLDAARCHAAGFSAGAYTVMLLAGAITLASQYEHQGEHPGDGRFPGPFSMGPREFPDLAAHLPGLLESSAIFRASWARMSDSYLDPRIKTILACAPGRSVRGFDDAGLTAIDRKVLIIVGDADEVAPAEQCAHWLEARLPQARLEILQGGVGHYVFLPEATETGRRTAPDICIDAPGIDRRVTHDRVATAALCLFAGEVRGPVAIRQG
ncbi:MAG: dienelactone hydrolase [Rhodospirillaceae bacterium]|nr:MAG: dienelactone hydrolase [Rhodospirillaceae bacterium]